MPLNPIFITYEAKLQARFSFITDHILRTNIAVTFGYLIFLIALEKREALPGPIVFSLYKDMLVQTAIVVESCVHHTLKRFIEEEIVKGADFFGFEWKEDKCVVLEEFDNGNRQACGVVRHKSLNKLARHTNFLDINRACLRSGIFTQDVFDKAEKLRESRNKIHLAGLDTIDELYKKEDVDQHFHYAQIILQRLEEKLLTL